MDLTIAFNSGGFQFDGATAFSLNTANLQPDADGIIQQTLTANGGVLQRASLNALLGTSGFFISAIQMNVVAPTIAGVAIQQPNTQTGGGAYREQQWLQRLNSAGTAGIAPSAGVYKTQNFYVPPGWNVVLFANAAGTYSFTLTFYTVADVESALEAMAACDFPFPRILA